MCGASWRRLQAAQSTRTPPLRPPWTPPTGQPRARAPRLTASDEAPTHRAQCGAFEKFTTALSASLLHALGCSIRYRSATGEGLRQPCRRRSSP